MSKKHFKSEIGLKISVSENWAAYEGTKEELFNEGVCTHDMFPIGNKRKSYYYDLGSGRASNKCWSIEKIKDGRFRLSKGTYDGKPFSRLTRNEDYDSPQAWLASCKKSAEIYLWIILSKYTGGSEESVFGGTAIKAPKKKTDEHRALSRKFGAIFLAIGLFISYLVWPDGITNLTLSEIRFGALLQVGASSVIALVALIICYFLMIE